MDPLANASLLVRSSLCAERSNDPGRVESSQDSVESPERLRQMSALFRASDSVLEEGTNKVGNTIDSLTRLMRTSDSINSMEHRVMFYEDATGLEEAMGENDTSH